MKLRQIINEIINEGKQVGTVYHFTDLESAIKIIKTDFLKAGRATKNINSETISTTRDKNFIKRRTEGNLSISGGDIGFELDGNKLSNTYQVMPYDDAYDQSDKEYDEDDKENFGDEQEEIWYGKKIQNDGGIENILKYVKSIIISSRFKKSLINSPEKIGIKGQRKEIIKEFPNIFDLDVSPSEKLNDVKKFFEDRGLVVKID